MFVGRSVREMAVEIVGKTPQRERGGGGGRWREREMEGEREGER